MYTSTPPVPTVCQHCGMLHAGMCPRVRSIEYHQDGTAKRVEFHEQHVATPLRSPNFDVVGFETLPDGRIRPLSFAPEVKADSPYTTYVITTRNGELIVDDNVERLLRAGYSIVDLRKSE